MDSVTMPIKAPHLYEDLDPVLKARDPNLHAISSSDGIRYYYDSCQLLRLDTFRQKVVVVELSNQEIEEKQEQLDHLQKQIADAATYLNFNDLSPDQNELAKRYLSQRRSLLSEVSVELQKATERRGAAWRAQQEWLMRAITDWGYTQTFTT